MTDATVCDERLSQGDTGLPMRRGAERILYPLAGKLAFATLTIGQTCNRFAPTADFFATLSNVSAKLRLRRPAGGDWNRARSALEWTSCPTGGRPNRRA